MKFLFFFLFLWQLVYSNQIGFKKSLFSNKYDIKKLENNLVVASASGVELYKEKESKLLKVSQYHFENIQTKLLVYKNKVISLGKNVNIFYISNNKIIFNTALKFNHISDINLYKHYLFVMTWEEGNDNGIVYVYDLDQNNKKITSFKLPFWYPGKSYIKNSLLIISNHFGGFSIFDIDTVSNITLLSNVEVSDGGGHSFFIDNKNRLFVSSDLYTYVYDLSDLDDVKEIGKIYNGRMNFYNFQEYENNKIIGIDGSTSTRLGIIDINDTNISKSNITYYEIGKNDRHYPYGLYKDSKKSKFYVCADDGIKSFKIENNKITIDALYEIPMSKKSIIIKDNYLFVNGGLNGLFIYKIENNNYKFIKQIKEDSKYSSLVSFLINKNYLYSIYTYGIFVYDISDPTNPKKVTSFVLKTENGNLDDAHGEYARAKISGDYLYVTKEGSLYYLWIFDIRDPNSISLVSKLNKRLTPGAFDIVGNYLYLTASTYYLITIDITDKSNPVMRKDYLKLSSILSITHNDKYLFVSSLYYLYIFAIDKENGNLSLVEQYDIRAISHMEIKNGYLYASYADPHGIDTNSYGFHIFNIKNINNIFDIAIPNRLSSLYFYIHNNNLYLGKAFNLWRGRVESIDIFDLEKLKEKHSLILKKGWNLVALPVFEEINASKISCPILWKWDNVDKTFLYYTKDSKLTTLIKNQGFKKFEQILPSEGFWVYCYDNVDINLTGKNYKIIIENLTSGWNLIGYGSDINVTSNIFLDVEYIWKYKNKKWYLWGKNIDDKYYKKYPKIKTISADEGVWILKK